MSVSVTTDWLPRSPWTLICQFLGHLDCPQCNHTLYFTFSIKNNSVSATGLTGAMAWWKGYCGKWRLVNPASIANLWRLRNVVFINRVVLVGILLFIRLTLCKQQLTNERSMNARKIQTCFVWGIQFEDIGPFIWWPQHAVNIHIYLPLPVFMSTQHHQHPGV